MTNRVHFIPSPPQLLTVDHARGERNLGEATHGDQGTRTTAGTLAAGTTCPGPTRHGASGPGHATPATSVSSGRGRPDSPVDDAREPAASEQPDPLASAPGFPRPQAVLDALTEAVYVVDQTRTIRYWNQAAERLTGYAAADVVGRRCRDGILNHVDDDGGSLCATNCPLLHTMLDGQVRQAHVYLHHAAGHRVPVEVRASALRAADGTIEGAVETFRRSAESTPGATWLQDLLTQAEREAATDDLTGLANRRAAGRVLGHLLPNHRRGDPHHPAHDHLPPGALPNAKPADPADPHPARTRSGRGIDFSAPPARCYQPSVAVLYVDVDHFKAVNDTYGHAVGDDVLRLVARTLRACARGNDTVARWGGEEFVIIAPLICPDGDPGHSHEASATTNPHHDDAISLAERLRRLVGTAWASTPQGRLRVSVSIGVAVATAQDGPAALIERADRAMLAAKANGRNRIQIAPPPSTH